MKQDESNQQFSQLTNTDKGTGGQYFTRPMAFKNGVLYIELILDRNKKYHQTYRQMAIQSALHYRRSESRFTAAVAAKICIYTRSHLEQGGMASNPDLTLESIIGIMYQDGILN